MTHLLRPYMENYNNSCATDTQNSLLSLSFLFPSSLPLLLILYIYIYMICFFVLFVVVFAIACVLYIDDNYNLFLLLNWSAIVEDILQGISFSAIIVIEVYTCWWPHSFCIVNIFLYNKNRVKPNYKFVFFAVQLWVIVTVTAGSTCKLAGTLSASNKSRPGKT